MLKSVLSGVLLVLLAVVAYGENPEQRGQRGSGDGMSASGMVQGVLLDEEHQTPLMYASVVLFTVKDSTMVSGSISEEDGSFVIENISPGNYYIAINYIGYPEQLVNDIRITPREREVDLGTIAITPDTATLSEVTVEATRELMEVGLDRRVFNVEQELTSVGGSALDLMQNIPSVAVDFDGNVSLRGSDNVTILIDGRPSGLLGLTGSEALEQLPSEMVERVEVITNPSARYDPDGTSGIINIVMKEERDRGYNGMVSLNAGTGQRYTGSANLNYHVGSVNLFANYSGRLISSDGYGSSFRTNTVNNTHLDQESDFDFDMDAHNFTVGMDYRLSDRHRLTTSFGYNTRDMDRLNYTDYQMLDSQHDLEDAFYRETLNYMDHGGYQVNLSHERTFDQEHREWTTDFTYSSRGMDRSQENEQVFMDHMAGDRPNIFENTFTDGNMEMFRIQTDYTHPIGGESKLELGAQAYVRERDQDFAFYDFDHDSESWIINEGLSNHYIHSEQRYSAYGMYSTVLGNYSIQGGLRAEYADILVEQQTMDEDYPNDYFSLFPTLHIRRNFTQTQSAQLSYSRRINRPRGRQLNPFPSYNDPYDISSGNPLLDPEYTNSLELGYTRFGERTTLNPSIFYRHTEGMITRFRTMDDDGIAYTTFENLNRGISLGSELALTYRATDWWRINGTMSYFYRQVEGGGDQMELQNESYSWSTRMVNNFTFPRGWSAQLTGRYRSPLVMIQGEMKEMYSADFAVRKNVLNNNATISLRLSDIFDTQRFKMYNYGDNFTLDSERRRNSRMVFIGFTYRINEYERDRRRERGDMDDDMDFDEFEM